MRDPPLGPPSTLGEIFRHTCLQSHIQTSPPTPQKSYTKFRNPRTTFEISPFSGQNRVILGGRGGPRIFFLLESSYFCYLGAHAKFQIPTICPYWGLATAATTRKGKICKIPLAPMGVLAPGSAHARPSAWPPIDTSGNFSAHVSAESPSNIPPYPPK